MLGDNIFKLRKKEGLSQEQLAEQVNVTRQTISNWELNETTPNPEQLKLLSMALNISIDELLNNDIRNVLVEKVSNTERLAGIIIKIIKVIGILFLSYLLIIIFGLILFSINIKDSSSKVDNQTVYLECSLNDKNYSYLIESDSDDNIIDSSGSEFIVNIVKDKKISKGKILVEYIESYFKDKGGDC